MTPTTPKLTVDLSAMTARYRAIFDTRTADELFQALAESAADVRPLLAEVERLWLLLLAARLRYANLRAAAQATLSAHRDGELDPLAYVADELSTQDMR